MPPICDEYFLKATIPFLGFINTLRVTSYFFLSFPSLFILFSLLKSKMYRLAALSRATKPFLYKQKVTLQATTFNAWQLSRRSFATAPESNDSGNYIASMYSAWLHDPSSVHSSWQVYFKNLGGDLPQTQASGILPSMMPSDSARLPELSEKVSSASSKGVIEHMKIQLLVRAYQVRGHLLANLDPLRLERASDTPELTYEYYGFTEKDLDRKFTLGPGILPALGQTEKELTLRDIIDTLKKMYCKYIPEVVNSNPLF